MSTWQDELRDVEPSVQVIVSHQLHQDGVHIPHLGMPKCGIWRGPYVFLTPIAHNIVQRALQMKPTPFIT